MNQLFRSALLGGALLALTGATQAQSLRYGIELGLPSSITADLVLSDRIELSGKAGITLTPTFDDGFKFGGASTHLSLEPRWYLSKHSSSDSYRSGCYLTLRGVFEKSFASYFASASRGKSWYTDDRYTISILPTIGYTIGVSDTSYIRLGAGIAFAWTKYRNSDGYTYWLEPKSSGGVPVVLEATYGITL